LKKTPYGNTHFENQTTADRRLGPELSSKTHHLKARLRLWQKTISERTANTSWTLTQIIDAFKKLKSKAAADGHSLRHQLSGTVPGK